MSKETNTEYRPSEAYLAECDKEGNFITATKEGAEKSDHAREINEMRGECGSVSNWTGAH